MFYVIVDLQFCFSPDRADWKMAEQNHWLVVYQGFFFFFIDSADWNVAEWDEGPVIWPPVLFFFACQTRQSNCGRWQSGTSGQRATTWRMRVVWCVTPPTSPNCVCQSFSPWNSWSKPRLNVSSPTPTPTTSTLYRSTATRRRTSLPMTCASTCGI